MDDALERPSLPDELAQLRSLLAAREQQLAEREATITQHQTTIATFTAQRDEYYLEELRLEVRLAKTLKQVYGPRADRVSDPVQRLLELGRQWEALPIQSEDLPSATAHVAKTECPVSRRLRTRGRRDIGALDHLPLMEQTYELTGDLCLTIPPAATATLHRHRTQSAVRLADTFCCEVTCPDPCETRLPSSGDE